ncbi:Cyclin-D-binding Myb-like transcription factor 1 [Linum perenne]
MVNGEAGLAEIVDRNEEEGNSRKKRKRAKGDDFADSSSGIGRIEVEHGVGSVNGIEVEERRKKKKKRKNDQEVTNDELDDAGVIVGNQNDNGGKVRFGTVTENPKSSNEKKEKKKKKIRHSIDKEVLVGDNEANGNGIRDDEVSIDEPVTKNSEKKEKKKKKQIVVQGPVLQGDDEANEKGLESKASTENTENSEEGKKGKRRKKKKQTSDIDKRVEIGSATTSPTKSTSKTVSFSEDVEVFPIPNDDTNDETTTQDANELVRGKRYSPEEDKLIQAACLEYVNSKGFAEDAGIKMIMNAKKHREVWNCWKEISAALPWRPRESVSHRAHILFQRGKIRKWTEEERELVLQHYKEHGSEWKSLAEKLGKYRHHVKDLFRRMKVGNRNSGRWSQDEYQNLFDLVNEDLRVRALVKERKSKYGMLRDNIGWTAISDKLDTRSLHLCCQKWYKQLTSPMVAQGKWLDTDDYRLSMELYNLDACCMEDVDWDSLLEHRSGDLCRKRWSEIVKHLGDCRNKSFNEQVEIVANRYCSDVLDAREAYASKPLVD